MTFCEALKKYRLDHGIDEAAEKLNITPKQYFDIEYESNYVDRHKAIGVLVCLGYNVEKAMEIADEPSIVSIGDSSFKEHFKFRQTDPFVSVEDGYVTLCERGGSTYDFPTSRIDSAEKGIAWINHLSEKLWVTPRHINELTKYLIDSLKLNTSV